jgi:hypothetical protein
VKDHKTYMYVKREGGGWWGYRGTGKQIRGYERLLPLPTSMSPRILLYESEYYIHPLRVFKRKHRIHLEMERMK